MSMLCFSKPDRIPGDPGPNGPPKHVVFYETYTKTSVFQTCNEPRSTFQTWQPTIDPNENPSGHLRETDIYIYMKSHEHVPLNFFTPFVHHTVGNFVAWTAQNSHPSVLDEQVVAVGLYISSENRRKPHPRPAFTFNSCSPAPFLLSRVKRLQNAPFPRWLSELRSMVEVCSADVQRKRYSGFRVDRTNVEGRWLKWTSICLRHLGGPVPSTLKPVY